MASLSLIIAVYRRADFLERVFASLTRQTFRDYEVVVADDGSGPDMAAVIERYREVLGRPVRHVWHEDEGFRKTIIVNRAAAEAASPYLVFIDGDCILHRRFLERHSVRRRDRQVLAGRRVMFDRDLTERVTIDDITGGRVERVAYWWKHAGKNDRRNGFYAPFLYGPRNRFRHDHQILGSNFSVHRADFFAVNGYDERIIGRGLEDNNLSARFLNSGMPIHCVRFEALQYHCFHTSDPIPHSREFIEAFRSSGETRTPYGIVKD